LFITLGLSLLAVFRLCQHNVIDWPGVEPADDYTALSILAFAQQVTYS